jgi:hypothetical protein
VLLPSPSLHLGSVRVHGWWDDLVILVVAGSYSSLSILYHPFQDTKW